MSPGTQGGDHWWRTAVIYECHLPVFKDGNGDGIGDLLGLADGIDYLKDVLGIDAVWTGPFYRSPLLDQGFDVSDYLDIEPVFGSMADFDGLLERAHKKGVRIIVDYIPNHTSDQHPWFVESRSSRDNPKSDWYVWRNPALDGRVPNNWTSEAGGSVWEFDPARGQYYLHSHLVEQPDLNWRNPEVRDAMFDALRYWLARGADGVRIDVAHMLMKHPDFPDNPVSVEGNGNPFDLQHPDFGTQVHLYDRRHPDIHATLRELRAVADEFDNRVTIAEIEAMPWGDWAEYFGDDLGGMHLPFPFRLLETKWVAEELATELRDLYANLPDGGWPILALGNHDRSRLASRVGAAQARVAAVLLLTLRGTPCVFAGDELGLVDRPVPDERQRDYFARSTGGVSRDPVRIPMPWTAERNGGFSEAPENELWLPVTANFEDVSIEAQVQDAASILNLYRTLLRVRLSEPALRDGEISMDAGRPGDHPSVLRYTRSVGARRVEVLLNLGDASVPIEETSGAILVGTHERRDHHGTWTVLGGAEALVLLTAGGEGA